MEQKKKATITYDGKTEEFDVIVPTIGKPAIDISSLVNKMDMITFDLGYQNTSAHKSTITYIDGEKGILQYRGIPIEELAEKSTFVETAYLLIYGKLPTRDELALFSRRLTEQSMLHEDMKHFFSNIPQHAHPMAILSSVISSLSIFYQDVFDLEGKELAKESIDLTITRLISKIRTIAALSHKKFSGEPFVYPERDMTYVANFLNMMFSSPVKSYEVDPEVVKILNALLILHGDHGQNCSTSTVRLVGSSRVNLYASVCAGICALWGPLHGGANQRVIEMVMKIRKEGLTIKQVMDRAKDKNDPTRLMGIGHRVYKTYDPRAKIIKKICYDYLNRNKQQDPLLEIALELEEAVLKDEYFVERQLFPNVDFFSGLVYRAIGIPTNMFTVMFAIGRLPGWIAQWKEMRESMAKIGRPRQVYTGPVESHYVPIDNRLDDKMLLKDLT